MTSEQILTGLLRTQDVESLSFGPADLTKGDWDEVISLARRHGLAPQLFARLNELDTLSILPDDLGKRLRDIYLGGVVRGLRLSVMLSEILVHFNTNKIPVIVLKGPHLAELVYKDWALRSMGDFDLMVKRADLPRAIAAMNALGYMADQKFLLETYADEQPHLPSFVKDGKIPVELHWTIEQPLGPFKIDPEGIWKRAQKTKIAGADTLVLSNEDLLIYHCIHASYRHRFGYGLLPLYDASQIVKILGYEINWERLRCRAEEWGALKCVYLTLYLGNALFKAEADQEFMQSITPPDADNHLLEQAMGLVFSRGECRIKMTENLIQVWTEKTFSGKIRRLLINTFPSPHVLAGVYPVLPSSKRIYYYYLVRVKDLIQRHGKTLLALLRQDAAAVTQAKKEAQGYALADWLTLK
jgi:hypothetical protein